MKAKKKSGKRSPAHGDLRIWWIAQVPGKPFLVDVKSVYEAKLLLDALARYDQFQLDHNIKPDYCNAGGLSVFDDRDDHDSPSGSWCDYYDVDGNGVDDYTLADLFAKGEPTWEAAR